MKPEIDAAAEFLSRIFLAHDNITKEKVGEFKQHLSTLLEERFRNHWHETCPTKGQAYRCIRVCPEEPLDPILEKVCFEVGINPGDFNLPFELTLWVDPTEVVCKFGDLKCSYHTVAKKDHSSGNLDNQAQNLDIDDLVENARDLYLKKQTVINHPVHSTEMHITNPYSDGTSNGISTAIRINGTMHYASGSPPPGYDGSPRGKGKPAHSIHHKRGGGFHYYGKSSGGKGTYISNGTINSAGSHVTSAHHIYPHHRNHNHHHPHNHHHHGSSGQNATAPYSNGYLNGYGDENGYGYDQRSVSPTKMMNIGTLPAISSAGGPGQISQSSPTPEQIQQQMQHPPPMPPPPPIPPHLHQAFSHAPTDTTTLPPPPPQQPPPSSSATTIDTTSSNSNINSNGAGSGKPSSNGSNSKFQSTRGIVSSRNKQSSPVKVTK
ncbi:BTG family protein-like [Physella acuta]|uniref:BTG family protein-like n=1 Tax=Physella acuta TaxID=109671 RepID=UPI0027DE4CBF|nr:BTG family protein-like [Physella acuta]XP_059141868.1 BTG family protein-like [Physella acuta]XP_059141942.1 BTG family protein-like [Physella acuta]